MYPDTIPDNPVPLIGGTYTAISGTSNTDSSSGVETPVTIKDRDVPLALVAVDTISDSLDTQTRKIKGSFGFEQLGSIKIGDFTLGVNGEIDISPDGIVATDRSGNNTITIDGSTGDITLRGTLQAGSVIAGATEVGSPNVVIDGANARIVINDGTYDRVLIGYDQNGF